LKKIVGVILSGGESLSPCLICGKEIKKGDAYRRLPPDSNNPMWRYYHWPKCGPGTEGWYRFHPCSTARLLMNGKKMAKERRLQRIKKKR
jgi:hypothetical protein